MKTSHTHTWIGLLATAALTIGGACSEVAAQTVPPEVKCPANTTASSPAGGAVVCTPVPVTPPPPTTKPPTLTVNANPSEPSPGATVTLNAVIAGGQAPFDFALTLAGKPVTLTPTSAASGTVVAPTTAGQHIYTVTLTDALKRTATAQVTVTVKAAPPPPPPPPAEVCGDGIDNDQDGQVDEGCPVVPPPPPPPTRVIYPAQVTDLEVLGQVRDGKPTGTGCPVETHDKFLLDGGDGRWYYTWHPQRDPSGCVYGHEHGHDPQPARSAIIQWVQSRPVTAQFTQTRKDALLLEAQQPILFGYITARAAGHPPEPHEGFKQFYTVFGECNEEGRCSQMISEHTTHMGTGGVGRFDRQHHSVRKLQIHVPSGSYELVQGMLDFGTADMVCDPRQSPTRDFITLNSRCRIQSAYEIWQGTFEIRQGSQTLYRGIATPAVFDVITVRNPANPTEVVYAWDPRVVATTRQHATPSWADHRGSDREAYAQPGYFATTQHMAVWADVMTGQVVPANTAGALPQFFWAPQTGQNLRGSTGVPADNGNPPNHAFKVRRPNNDLRAFLGLKN